MKEVEYSEDFQFFLENQVFVINSQDGTTICSRLEARTFYESESRDMNDNDINSILEGIHQNLIEGRKILKGIKT